MNKEEENSEGEGVAEMIPKREVATKLAYVKLRNWSYAYEQVLHKSDPKQDISHLRYTEPCLVHVDYPELVQAALGWIDADGRVYRTDMLTGATEISEPIPTHGLALSDEDTRRRISTFLAQKMYETAWEIVRSRHWAQASPLMEGEEFFTAGYEGYMASLLAPYRHDENLLTVVAALAAEAQNQGQLGVYGGQLPGNELVYATSL